LSLDTVAKGKIKQEALITLGSPSTKAGSFASQVVAAIAAVELPQGQWPDLIELLLGFVNNTSNTNLRVATLQTIGFICESIVRVLFFTHLVSHHIITETPNPELAVKRNLDSRDTRRKKGGTLNGRTTCGNSRIIQLLGICSREL
jgi:hypothetical protein